MKKDFRIGFFGVKSWEREIIEKEISGLDSFGVGIFEGVVEENIELAKKYEVLSVFVNSSLNKKVLAKLPDLKMIATRSTGMDHIDIDECKRRKIVFKKMCLNMVPELWPNMHLLYFWL